MLGPIINPGVNTGGSKFQSKRKMLEQEAISRRPGKLMCLVFKIDCAFFMHLLGIPTYWIAC